MIITYLLNTLQLESRSYDLGAGVLGTVYLKDSVKTDHLPMSWRLISLSGPISIWSFFACGSEIGWGVWSTAIVSCWG